MGTANSKEVDSKELEQKEFVYKYDIGDKLYFILNEQLRVGYVLGRSSKVELPSYSPGKEVDKTKLKVIHETYTLQLKSSKWIRTNNVNELFNSSSECVENLLENLKDF